MYLALAERSFVSCSFIGSGYFRAKPLTL